MHDLRHVAATMALKAGAKMKVVQEMLGHSSCALNCGHVHRCPARAGHGGSRSYCPPDLWSGHQAHSRAHLGLTRG
ncbi:tyrosine-type recombinase/integrase [Micromonospora sp. HUAS LYJ1]|nr:tyrosine-type recombinase/integrase [Micromonospora sp. HUAS LYJ1]WKU08557.1 tyrosine-type recombinase/integrase [Micromonospora sp. HUAS LYJ1]